MPADAGLRDGAGHGQHGPVAPQASSTVCSEPPARADSTTTTTSASAAMMRLRAGNRHRAGGVPSGASRDEHPAVGDLVATAPVAARVDDVEAGADHADRRRAPRGVEGAAVGGAVDADGQAGHHGDAGRGQLAAEAAGDVEAVAACTAACRRRPTAGPAERRAGRRGRTGRQAGRGRRRSAAGQPASPGGEHRDAGRDVARPQRAATSRLAAGRAPPRQQRPVAPGAGGGQRPDRPRGGRRARSARHVGRAAAAEQGPRAGPGPTPGSPPGDDARSHAASGAAAATALTPRTDGRAPARGWRRARAAATCSAPSTGAGAPVEVGEGAGHGPDPGQAAGREPAGPHAPRRGGRRRPRRATAHLVEPAASSSALAARPRSPATARARATRSATAAVASPGGAPSSSSGVGPGDLDPQVEPVEQRARQPAEVAGPGARVAPAGADGPPSPHGHGFVAPTSRNRAGSSTASRARPPAPRPPRAAGAGRRARRPGTRPSRRGTAPRGGRSDASPGRRHAVPPPTSDGDRRAVVRRPERRPAHEAAGRQAPARRPSRRRWPRGPAGRSSGGQQARRAAGPASSCRRRAGPTSSRWWPPAAATSSARRATGWPRTSARSGCEASTGPASGAAGRATAPRPRSGGERARRGVATGRTAGPADHRGLGGGRGGHDDGGDAGCVGEGGDHRHQPGHRPHRAVEAELADEGQPVDRLGRRRRRRRRARRRRWRGRARCRACGSPEAARLTVTLLRSAGQLQPGGCERGPDPVQRPRGTRCRAWPTTATPGRPGPTWTSTCTGGRGRRGRWRTGCMASTGPSSMREPTGARIGGRPLPPADERIETTLPRGCDGVAGARGSAAAEAGVALLVRTPPSPPPPSAVPMFTVWARASASTACSIVVENDAFEQPLRRSTARAAARPPGGRPSRRRTRRSRRGARPG